MTTLTDDLKKIRHKVQVIRNTFANTGTIDAGDLDFLCDRTVAHVALAHIAEGDWIRLKTLQVTSELEISDLVRQLDKPEG
jgi:hypothetical protein